MTAPAETAPALKIMHHDRHDPYGLKGTKLSTSNAAVAMKLADLDWHVTTVTTLADTVPMPLPVPRSYTTVRNDPNGKQTPLSTVGNTYHPLQNNTVFELLQQIVDDSGATFTAAGHTHGGRRTFVKMALPEGLKIGGLDPVETSLVAFNSHDGSGMLTIVPTAIRLFCTNQFPALKNSEVKFKARHTTGALNVGLDQIRTSLDLMFTSLDEFSQAAEVLVNTPFSTTDFDRLMVELEPRANRNAPASLQLKSAITRADAMRATFLHAPNLDNVRGTAWSALQAVIEVMDWNAKGDNAERMVTRSPASEAVKSRAFALLAS